MKRILIALAAVALPLSLAASAQAAAVNFTDPAGDVRDIRDADMVAQGMWADAPLSSIDHTSSTFARTVVSGRPGTKITVKVADLMTAAESTRYAQNIVPHIYFRNANGFLTSALVTIRAGKPVIVNARTCRFATSRFDTAINKVVAFVPNTCFPKTPESAVMTTYLLNADQTYNMAFDNGRGKVNY